MWAPLAQDSAVLPCAAVADDGLEAAWAEARRAWSDVVVGRDELAAWLDDRRDDGALPAYVTDLYLTCALARGDRAAVAAFDRVVLPRVRPAVARIARGDAAIDEVCQRVRVRLLVAGSDGPPRIAAYRGRGPLHAWLRVTAVRAALDFVREGAPAAAVDDVLAELGAAEPDPETRHLKDTYRADYAAALTAALAALPERARAQLRLHYVDGLPLAAIGRLYGVHESTASRWVRAALRDVADGARTRLVERLAVSGSAADSIARMVRSGLDLSIRAVLRDFS